MSRLHWYAPGPRREHYWSPPSRWNRQKIYIPEEHAYPASKKHGRDRYGPYVWMINDCGWEWLGSRPGVRWIPPLRWLFDRLHEHVHTPGSW